MYSVIVEQIHSNLNTFNVTPSAKLRSPCTDFYITAFKLHSRYKIILHNPFHFKSILVVRDEIMLQFNEPLKYNIQDKNEFFQLSILYDYHDLNYEDLIKIKEIYDAISGIMSNEFL